MNFEKNKEVEKSSYGPNPSSFYNGFDAGVNWTKRELGWQLIETAPTKGRVQILLQSRFDGSAQMAWADTWWIGGFSAENKPKFWMAIPTSEAEVTSGSEK